MIDADWCNGSTADSDSVSRGSSPLSVAIDAEYFVRDTQHFAFPSIRQKGPVDLF